MAGLPEPRMRNAILASLPPGEWDCLRSHLHPVNLIAQTTIYGAGQRIDHAYFLLTGYVSLLILLNGDSEAEVGSVNSGGMVGASLVLGRVESTTVARVQLPTRTLRMDAAALVAHAARLPTLRRLLLHHAGTQAAQSMQLAACNAHHTLDARLARCLLGLHDHCQGDELTLTHENLGALLCAHRPSVTVSLKRLQKRSLVQQHSRSIAITDRSGLEQASCGCYAALRGLEDTQEPPPGTSGRLE